MPVEVVPAEFRLVFFDATHLGSLAEQVVARLGLAERPVRVEVDETTPLSRISTDVLGGTIVVRAESGAFEDTRRPRHLSDEATVTALGRVLLRAADRLSGRFDEAPADPELTVAQVAAWDAYAVGRLARAGTAVHRSRWLYNFRNRHGFTDAADRAFDRLWLADGLTWDELDAISAEALRAGAGSA